MSAYCDADQVKAEFKNIDFTASDALVTSDTVDEFIEEFSDLIDSFISGRYTVPVTSKMITMFCRVLVSERIKGILETKQAAPNGQANQNVKTGMSVSDVMKLLAKIRDGEMSLPGAEEATIQFYSYTEANNICPEIRKDRVQW